MLVRAAPRAMLSGSLARRRRSLAAGERAITEPMPRAASARSRGSSLRTFSSSKGAKARLT